MNRGKWSSPRKSLPELALKLCEEAAEVGTEITDALDDGSKLDIKATLNELDHVRFLCDVIERRVRRSPNST
jgi:hypothetical protein